MELVRCNFEDQSHRAGFLAILKSYMKDPMGDAKPHNGEEEEYLIGQLKGLSHCHIFFVRIKEEFAGMAVCFEGFSTFMIKKVLNIHDFTVRPGFRGRGVGKFLLRQTDRMAREMGCGKITLEVREDNHLAMGLYQKEGFEDSDVPMKFWTKYLD